jgi:phage-related protein
MTKTINPTLKTELQKAYNNPIILVEIALNSGTLRFCDNVADVVFPTGGNTYNAWEISFTPIRNSVRGEVDRFDITMDNRALGFSSYVLTELDASVGNIFQNRILTIKQVEGSKLANATYVYTKFSGHMVNPVLDENSFRVTVVSPIAKLNKVVGRLYQPLCPWTFKSTQCGYSGAETSCDKRLTTCNKTMSNMVNFGGFMDVPVGTIG